MLTPAPISTAPPVWRVLLLEYWMTFAFYSPTLSAGERPDERRADSINKLLGVLGARMYTRRPGVAPYWVQSARKAWHREAPSAYLERDEVLLHLPYCVRIGFERLEPAYSRGSKIWALRLGIAEIDEAELDREWISAPVQELAFREPVDEGADCDCCVNEPETAEERFEAGKLDSSFVQ